MEDSQRQKVLERFEHATEENTFVLTSFVDEELEIIDPYGGTLQTYGICFEMLKSTLTKVVEKLDGMN
jgi:protein-tyrosine phosphatase